MKLKSLLLASFILILVSCRNESGTLDLLNKSEALLATNPDSAYTVLNTVQNPGLLSNKLLARWCMLTGESGNKIHEDMPYPDLLEQAQTWYKKHGTAEEQARIGLFLGRSYAENKEYEKAMATYMEVLETADKNRVYNQAGYISSYMADLYEFKEMTDQAQKKYEEGADYFLKAGNTRSYALALRDIGRMWAFKDSVDKAFIYMIKADSIVRSINDRRAMASITNGLGNLYEMKKDYDKAEAYLLQSSSLEDRDNDPTYLALSGMYINSGNIEKARSYLKKIEGDSDNPYTSIGAIYKQYQIEKVANNTKEALKYLELYDAANDSISELQNESDILKIEKKYQQEKILKENNQLYIEKQKYFILLIILIIICLTILSFYQIKLTKKQKKIYNQQMILDKNKLTLIDLKKKLKEENSELHKAKNKLDTANKKIKEQSKLEEQKAKLEQINNEIMLARREKLLTSSIAKKVIKLSQTVNAGADKSPLTVKDWKAMQEQIDEIYISLPQLLKNEIIKFTPADLECCYLSFFDLDPQAEAILLNIDPVSASRRRSRLREKFNIKGINASLYEYLTKL